MSYLVASNMAFATPTPVKYRLTASMAAEQPTHYYVALLKLALSQHAQDFELQPLDYPMNDSRLLKNLNNGTIDIVWAMTNKQREQEAHPIRFPLLKGLLGYRVFVIRKQDQSKFSKDTHVNEIKSYAAVQGKNWVDVEILKANGFKVEGTAWVKSIYKTLSAGHFDYFPRSVIEANTELKRSQFNNLSIEQNHLLNYPTAVYFFVSKKNKVLAKAVENGLHVALENGDFDKLLFEHPAHKEALDLAMFSQRVVHQLHNPSLPIETPTQQALWFSLPE